MKKEFVITLAQAKKIKKLAQTKNISEDEIFNEALEAYLDNNIERESELEKLIKDLKESTEKAGASIDKGLANALAVLNELRNKRIKKKDRQKPESWNDFFRQEPCHDFPTIEELRASLGEDTPRESLDFSQEESEELFEKSNLLVQIEDYVFTCGVEQAAKRLNITKSEAQALAKGLIDEFTVEELRGIAGKLPSFFSSPFFDVGGVKTKATTQDILEAVRDFGKGKLKFIIALDLEGTLITNAEEQIPRPGLYSFLESCRELGQVVIYTMVGEASFRDVARNMVASGHAPAWFADIEHYHCQRDEYKDLDRIAGCSVENAVLVDDIGDFAAPGQEHRWISIPFVDPSVPKDNGFYIVLRKIRHKIQKKE